MRQKSDASKGSAEQTVRDIRRRTRKQYSSEEKIRIVLSGLRGEARDMKELVAELSLENRLLKKRMARPVCKFDFGSL